MNQEYPSPPDGLKPWYYQDWFLFPMFVFWPVWAVLILRSPWHNSIRSGSVAWAMIFVGLYYIVYRQIISQGQVSDTTVAWIAPGLVLTVITQMHWTMYRSKVRASVQGPVTSDATDAPEVDAEDSVGLSRGARRRPRGKGRRSGRSSRNRR